MFKPMFSLAFALITAAIFGAAIGLVWWGTGQYPSNAYRTVIGVLSALAAHYLEADLARRHTRRKRLPSPHRKTTA